MTQGNEPEVKRKSDLVISKEGVEIYPATRHLLEDSKRIVKIEERLADIEERITHLERWRYGAERDL